MKKYNKEHPEDLKNNLKRWQKTSYGKERIKIYQEKRKEKEHKMTKQEWMDCKSYFNNSCAYCGISEQESKLKFNELLHKEHLYHEGRNDIKNCVPSCKECNSEKHEKTLNEWYNGNNQKYTYERYHKIYQWIRFDCKKFIKKKKAKKKYIRKAI
jgi:hypothetical protein